MKKQTASPKQSRKAAKSATAFGVLFILAATSNAQVKGRKLVDARTAIGRITANDPEAKIELAETTFRRNMADLSVNGSKLRPHEAAIRWLVLVDEAVAIPHRSLNGMMGGAPRQPIGTLSSALGALPGPETWAEIRSLVEQRPPSLDKTVLQLLGARLVGDDEAVIRLCKEYDQQAQKTNNPPTFPTVKVRLAALRRLGKPLLPEDAEKVLTGWNMEPANLNDVLPAKSIQKVILDCVKAGNDRLNLGNRQNLKLAQEVVLSHLEELPTPPWSLAQDWRDSAYVQRLIEHYGNASLVGPNSYQGQAQGIYLLNLSLAGKMDEAIKLIQDLSDGPNLSPDDFGPVPAGFERFVFEIQKRLPHKDLWNFYVNAAIASGDVREAITCLKAKISDAATSREQKLSLLGLLLSLDKRIGDLAAVKSDCKEVRKIVLSQDGDPTYGILEVGLAVKDSDLIDIGIANDVKAGDTGSDLLQVLVNRGRSGDAVRLLVDAFRKQGAEALSPDRLVEGLCTIYHEANRPEDVMALMTRFPDWPNSDLGELIPGSQHRDSEMAFNVAWSLSSSGKADLAVRALRSTLLIENGPSEAYELLNQIGGAAALKIYDDLILAHPFVPDPVLWKADLLLRLGRTEPAEEYVKEAIRIDPIGKHDYRQKLVDLSRQILLKKGDTAGAARYEKLGEAIRLASHADNLEACGLLSRGVEALRQAVQIYPEDASLQAQLGHDLEILALPSEADTHYRKAFELLPAALGEGSSNADEINELVYRAETSPKYGEIVDAEVKGEPNNADAYYARGLVNLRAGFSRKAAEDFRRTVEEDPRHLEAWEQLSDLAHQGILSPKEAQESEYRIIDLGVDWVSFDISEVSDLATAYRKIQAKLSQLPGIDRRPIFPLHTSQKPDKETLLESYFYYTRSGLGIKRGTVGSYFEGRSDIGMIAGLFHRTNYPLE